MKLPEYITLLENFFPVDWDSVYITISEKPRPTPIDIPVNTDAIIDSLDPNPNLYAVFINGAGDGVKEQRFWNDMSAMYCTLLGVYGYTKENIFVHYVDGYSNQPHGDDLDGDDIYDDIDYDAYKETIKHTFEEMAGETDTIPEIPELEPEDALFIFVEDHGFESGGNSWIDLPGYGTNHDLADFELAEYLEDINCAQIIALFQPCFMGGFLTELSDYNKYEPSCKNRSIQTASNEEESWNEYAITQGNYCEFVYYWTAAARGYYPDDDYPWLLSYAAGSFDSLASFFPDSLNHPGDHNPDLNGDGFIQMGEAFDYANDFDSHSEYEFFDVKYITANTIEEPLYFTDISFHANDDLLTLCGLAGKVEHSGSLESRNFMIGGELSIQPDVNISFYDESGIYFGNETAELVIELGGSLEVEENVSFFGNNNNRITVNGEIEINYNVTFNGINNSYFDGLYLYNSELETDLDYATFNNCNLHNYGIGLDITNSHFEDSEINSYLGDVSISSNSTFTNSWLHLENQWAESLFKVTITNCVFSNGIGEPGIDIWNYDDFAIENNNIHDLYNGIQILNCGEGKGDQNIYENNIYNNSSSGIIIYNSNASIWKNEIKFNNYGVKFYNNSNIGLYGNPNAQSLSGTQYIHDNDSCEVYASQNSFPFYFKHNGIIDEDNASAPSDPLVYHNQVLY